MTYARVFKHNGSQAVYTPRVIAFPEGVTELVAIREGKGILLVPAGAVWHDFFNPPGVDIGPRDQPLEQFR